MSDEPEPSSRARWLGVALILLVLAGLVWQAWVGDFAVEPPPEAVPMGAVGRPSLSEMLARVDAARLGMEAASAAAAAKPPLAADEVEVCGVGRVKADESGRPKDMAPMQRAAQSAREHLLPALLASPDEVPRAAGLLLQSVNAAGAGDSAPPAPLLARDALASLALSTRSPQVYAWAMRACQGDRSDGMCRLLTAGQWARLEPGNAIAWLQVAVDAQARNDAAAVAEAMFRVSHASRVDTHWGVLTGVALSKLPPDTSALAKGALAEELLAIEAGLAAPHLVASQYCAEADLRDANRRQTCSAVAEVFFHAKGSSLTDLGISAALGERVGWPAERLDAVRDERDAVLQVYAQRAAAVRERWSCAALAQTARHLADVAQQGEIAVMRRALKELPDSAATLARRYRDALAKPAAGDADVHGSQSQRQAALRTAD